MPKLPVLKPQELVARLEKLGFLEVRHAVPTNSSAIQTAAEPRCRSTRGENLPRIAAKDRP